MALKRWKLLLVVFLVVLVALPGCMWFRRPEADQGDRNDVEAEMENFELMAFYEKGWSEATNGVPALEKHAKDIKVLMPFWYAVEEDGSVSTPGDKIEDEVINIVLNQKDLQVLPLVVNRGGSNAMLTDPDIRSTAVNNLVQLVNTEQYGGLTIDFELLSPDDQDGLTQFTSELYKRLKNNNRSLAITVFPKVEVTADVSGAYDYQALKDVVDYFIIMTYDRHEETSGPGSVAPAGWVESNIRYALDQGVPKDKLVITIGAYGFDWPEGGQGEYLGLREILARANEVGADIKWDEDSRSPYFTYDDNNGTFHTVWFENGYSAADRIQIAKNYKLRGAAIWRVGFEDEEYWSRIIAAAKQK